MIVNVWKKLVRIQMMFIWDGVKGVINISLIGVMCINLRVNEILVLGTLSWSIWPFWPNRGGD